MRTYDHSKKLITRENNNYENGNLTAEEYNLWKDGMLEKLDVFLLCKRITAEQYKALTEMLISITV